ncbi:uncharacterized protein LOC123657649 [Melitaea cinxia]|uniref:uncharacterized protein LOC123657649 n=1 Tax=Melitaea cinxia TaxID=113334 RepID=UPI001E273D05|nr:uncharacterized protein LOC123657649 [Melitaea cinxia]
MADKLIKRRSSMKAKLTSFSNYLEVVKSCEILSELQIIELESRFDKYNALYSEYDELQTEIETLADKPEEAYAMRTQFEEQYYALLAVARSLLNKGSKRRDSAGFVTGSEASMTGRTKNNFIRLPKINLPHFDGSYQCWLEYRDTFNSLIHENTCIDDINKFHYLRASLKGTAAEIIKNIDFKGDNYIIAWNLICERYNNNRLLINNHVQALFNVEPLSTESSVSLRRLVDVTNKNIRALKTLNEPTEHWDTLIIYMMSIKLDLHTSRKWEEYRNTLADNSPTLSQFCTFINNTADLLETLQDNIKHNKTLYTNKLEKNNNTKSFIVTSENSKGKNTSANNSKFKCPMCSGKHFLYSCESYRKLPIESRIQKAKDFKVCMNCLRIGHVEKRCKFSHCRYCSIKHNTLLHIERTDIPAVLDPLPSTSESISLSANTLNLQPTTRTNVLLSTALVRVVNSAGEKYDARILLDNGSTANFISESLCNKLRLPRSDAYSKVTGINNQTSTSVQSCNLKIESLYDDYNVDIDCFILPEITRLLPSSRINIKDVVIPEGLKLADPSFHIPSVVDILVGADVFWSAIKPNHINLGKNQPKLCESKLGWLISGSVAYNSRSSRSHSCNLLNIECNNALSKFWELDSINEKHSLSLEERACEDCFYKNTTRKDDGRFVVTIPLKAEPSTLDIEKMYRAIEVNPSQRPLQRIVFRKDPTEPLKTYTLNTVTYGTASAPYLATKCLVTLSDLASQDNVKESIRHDFYVDDYLSGSSSISGAVELCKTVKTILKSAKFNLRKWQSNNSQILKELGCLEFNNNMLDLSRTASDNNCKTLGLNWLCTSDSLSFFINVESQSKVTKRHILSTISQIFDPLGLVSPCIIEAKIIMQTLWINKCKWDDELSPEITNLWLSFANTLSFLNNISIPRWILCNDSVKHEIHIFTDASEKAYGACVYIRSISNLGAVTVRLLTSKSRIAPIKPTTIPRLELCGALLGSRLFAKVKGSLTLPIHKFQFWCDSTIVLGWLAIPTQNLKAFVRNRVNEIQESTSNATWGYVPTKDNPADLVSRGLKANIISESKLWWSGPSFLQSDCNWPKQPNEHIKSQLPEELKNALCCIIRAAQREMFPEEYALLKSGKALSHKNRLIALTPFIDGEDIIRVGGRLVNSHYEFDVKHPILLCGPQLLLANIRQTYWPLGGRNLARSTVSKCIKCRRFRAQSIQPIMGQLPATRSELEFPFFNTSVDYAGPVLISDRKGRGSKLIKSYLCIFVCMATKAVHLELTTDLTKEAYKAALNRFMARRGKPRKILSDNGTSFVGACNEFKKCLQDKNVAAELAQEGIEFSFVPAYSPHFNGLAEAAVRSTKYHLKRLLTLTHLTYEELATCLTQIEAILNSRPLTPLSTNPLDLCALTPAHFLIGRSLMSVPTPQVTDINICRLERYQRVEYLKQHFWRRFNLEYLSILQQKTKWATSSDSLAIGTLVLIKDKALPPLCWSLGRVVQVYPGSDGINRVAELRTKRGTIRRAYNNICPLPIS